MGHSKALAALLLLFLVPGCASLQGTWTRMLRSPGMQLETFPDEVWTAYDCDDQKRPFFVMEANELVPRRLKPAQEFNHRMIYSMCPQNPTEVVVGKLHTRIRHRGTPIVRDTVNDYEIRPGRWIVDAFVTVPEAAQPGVYAFEVEFESTTLTFDERITFVVDER